MGTTILFGRKAIFFEEGNFRQWGQQFHMAWKASFFLNAKEQFPLVGTILPGKQFSPLKKQRKAILRKCGQQCYLLRKAFFSLKANKSNFRYWEQQFNLVRKAIFFKENNFLQGKQFSSRKAISTSGNDNFNW
jgi:hypothetical protein